jgi:hypothetical protein
MLTIAVTKFVHGAWIVVLLIPALVTAFMAVHRHYAQVAGQLSLESFGMPLPLRNSVLVLVGGLHRGVVHALLYAQTLSPSAKAVFVETDPDETRRLEEKWSKWGLGLPLIVLKLAVPLRPGTTARVHRSPARPGRRARGHHRAARVHSRPVVAARAPQPAGPAHQGSAALPAARDRHRRPLSPEALMRTGLWIGGSGSA